MTSRRGVVASTALPMRPFQIRRRSLANEQLPEIALRLSRVIRSGVPLETSLIQVDEDMGHRHRSLRIVASHLSVGRPLVDVSADWVANTTSDAERLLVGVIEMGVGAGADLATALDSVGEAIRDDVDHDKRRRILLTQTQMSAGVLVCLPLVFALVASFTRGFAYNSRLGVAFLLGGLVFDLIGVLWIRRLLRRLT